MPNITRNTPEISLGLFITTIFMYTPPFGDISYYIHQRLFRYFSDRTTSSSPLLTLTSAAPAVISLLTPSGNPLLSR